MKTIFETLVREHDRVIAITGAGGKTSLMFLLAHAFGQKREKVLTTTTTRILYPDQHQSPAVLFFQEPDFFKQLEHSLNRYLHVTVADHLLPENKLAGLSCENLEQIFARSSASRLIIEADGARCLSLKAPGDNEPVVPEWADVFISMVGLDCLGKPLTDENVFRPEKVAAITGLHIGDNITPVAVAKLAISPQGLLKGCPKQARSFVLLNKTDIASGLNGAEQVIQSAGQQQGRQPDFWIAGSLFEKLLLYNVRPSDLFCFKI